MSTPNYKHGDTTKICGTDCTFVAYIHAGCIEPLATDLGTPAPAVGVFNASCAFCPACHNNDACPRQPCSGGYWVTTDVIPLLKLRGMPGGDDGP